MPTYIDRELKSLIDPNKNKLMGVVGLSSTVIQVADRPGFVWIRLLDNLNEGVQAYNRNVSPSYNLPVLVSFDGVKYQIDDVDANRYANWQTSHAYLPNHGTQHSAIFGASASDIVWVDQKQWIPLLVTPNSVTGTNVVNVSPYVFKNSLGNWIYAGNTGAVIPPSPIATGSIIYLLYMRDVDGYLYTQPGPTFAGVISGALGFIPYLPNGLVNNNDIPLVAVLRTSNITGTPIGWDSLIDVRQFYKGYVTSPTGSSSFLETITTDSTLTGNGTVSSPLSVASSWTIEEADGTPSFAVKKLIFPNSTLVNNGGGTGTYIPVGGGGSGTGDVVGPASATDGHLAVYDGTTGKLIKDGGSALLTLAASTYIPTLYNTANVAASSAHSCQYSRVGNTVTVSGLIDIDTTSTGATTIGISLPIASNFTGYYDGAGVGHFASQAEGARIFSDPTNDRMTMDYVANNTSSISWSFIFAYTVM